MKIIQLILCLCLTFHFSYAGDEKGNGGNGILCYDELEGFPTLKLLDFYEAKTFRSIFYDLKTSRYDKESKIKLVTHRIRKFSNDFANELERKANDFYSEALFLRDIHLTSSEDSFHLGMPADKSCSVEQIVHQQIPMFPEDRKYIVDLDLWELLSLNHKVGLIFHEVIYSYLLDQKTSINVRYFNSIITSNRLDSYQLDQFISLMKKVGFRSLAYEGKEIDLLKPISYKTSKLSISNAYDLEGNELYFH